MITLNIRRDCAQPLLDAYAGRDANATAADVLAVLLNDCETEIVNVRIEDDEVMRRANLEKAYAEYGYGAWLRGYKG